MIIQVILCLFAWLIGDQNLVSSFILTVPSRGVAWQSDVFVKAEYKGSFDIWLANADNHLLFLCDYRLVSYYL